MGLYIRPAEEAERRGRRIELKESFGAMRSQLGAGEEACAVANRPHGKVALVILSENDHLAVAHDPDRLIGVFAIPGSLVPQE